MKAFVNDMLGWYGRYERPVSSISLIGGFLFEWFTLKRIDLFWENVWVGAHFFVITFLIILINFHENKADDLSAGNQDHKNASKLHFWYLTVLQGFFGGTLSTFLVFYFRSAEISVSWPFLLLLLAATVANEAFKKHYERLVFQISLFYLSLISFAIYIVPVFYRRIGADIFLTSGLISLVILFFFVLAIRFFAKEKFKENKKVLAVSVFGIFSVLNILYFLNLIPPIPLSLKDGGVYHSLARDSVGNYIVKYEDPGWSGYFNFYDDFHIGKGSPIYAYSAIFSPAEFNTNIIHGWQKYDENSGKWITATRINLIATGGREGGWRTYSMKSNITEGKWRVSVETAAGQVIGRLRFNAVLGEEKRPIKTEVKE